MTKYAAKILEIIAQSRNHMTAEQVLEALRQVYPAVAPATVYNNLNKLWAAGQIRKVSHPGMADRYDRTDKHDHLVCARCGKLLDINLADLTEQLQKQVNVPILAYDLKLIYLCESCQQESQSKQPSERRTNRGKMDL
ncbi:MAG TPA: transcriptional repressor [Candidatus Excrementavichristensenella intestinipullorum]|nr:transcriptional repressor [Candidatus Excrementavichristensenella intestinipullorum]